ncbi:hypothetical protein RZA67_04970 [Stenotrophomonas sp. C3(2023)]|uniref:hypothetical protein n=1 Tax=Stenotrophomonas sp. C3(2023) TaxID=3080277 RepID=UPI00293CD221|nr:hypothetical protein [Stenotrophomonas sp. C3(2023)]MDV3468086.1 hypothetical protein [Stenotrophomonas sp. C3(2023)]
MVFTAEVLELEIYKLKGLLQMLHADQPDVMDEVFQFHVGSLLSHAPADQHAHIHACAEQMRQALVGLPDPAITPRGANFRLMPRYLTQPA